ncbi:CG0192-related protein [Arthrobacter sp. HLT1-20]
MAIVYAAELRPSKMELLAVWLPLQAWFGGGDSALVRLGSFRFDDPDGEVGIETQLVGAGSQVYQVPLTYRGAPLAGAEEFLVGTMEHSVLGHRWVYDATGDPVYVAELAAALLSGKPQAAQFRETDGKMETLPETAQLSSTGASDVELPALDLGAPDTAGGVTSLPVGPMTLLLNRALGEAEIPGAGPLLLVSWAGGNQQLVIASVGDRATAP